MKKLMHQQFFYGLAGIVSLGLVSSERAEALDLTAPFALETAQVLPAGVRNPRFFNITMSMDSKYSGGGDTQPLGNPLNRRVRWSDVVKIQDNETDKSMIRAVVKDAKLSQDGSPGTTTGVVNTRFDVKVPALAIGLSNRWTMAVAVPIFNISVSADTGFDVSGDGQRWMNRLCTLSMDECNTAARKMNNSVNQQLTTYGYEPIQSKTISGVGDVLFVNRFNVYQDPENLWTIKSTISLPTGTGPNADLALDIPTGDGRFETGISLVYDRKFLEDYRWNAFGGATALLPNTMVKRIPTEWDNPVSPDKETLNRDLGSQFAFGTSLSRTFFSSLVAGAGYSFQFLTKPTYSGGALSPERYSYLENLTPSQALHSGILMAGFSSVEWYQNKKFFYPFQANVVFSHPFIGRNVTTNDVLAGELVLFF